MVGCLSSQGPVQGPVRPGWTHQRPVHVPCRASHTAIAHRFDADGDGKLTIKEVELMLQHMNKQQQLQATPQPSRPQGWDIGLLKGLCEAHAHGLRHAVKSLINTKLVRPATATVPASDVVYGSLGMFLGVLCLGCLNAHVKELPGVGAWHQRGLNLLLGSFGTICVLLFARPEAEAIRVWNLVVGHLVSVVAVVGVISWLGPGILSRAIAMGLALAAMMLTDSVHPPGGALVLLAEDSAAIQSMSGWFFIYPSLTWTIAILLPLGAVINWLKRHRRFDWPWQQAGPVAAGATGPAAPTTAATPPVHTLGTPALNLGEPLQDLGPLGGGAGGVQPRPKLA